MTYQINRAVWKWGRFIEGKQNETIEKAAPRDNHADPTITVPKYKPQQIHDMIYGELKPRTQGAEVDFGEMVPVHEYLRSMREEGDEAPADLIRATMLPSAPPESRPVDSGTAFYVPLEKDPEDEV